MTESAGQNEFFVSNMFTHFVSIFGIKKQVGIVLCNVKQGSSNIYELNFDIVLI